MTPLSKNEVLHRVHWAIEAAAASAKTPQGQSYVENVSVHTCGIEDGYGDAEHDIMVLGNWNKIWAPYNEGGHVIDTIAQRLGDVLEQIGVEIGWHDCWDTCVVCCKCVRTEPTGWGWKPNYVRIDGEAVCYECLDDVEYLESIEGKAYRANNLENIDPEECGYVRLMNFERGLHPGQNADPERIGKLLSDAGFRRWIFNIDSSGQFDTNISVWLHEEEAEDDDGDGLIRAKRVLERGETDGIDLRAGMENSLREAGRQADELRRQGATGPIVGKITPTSATTKEVTLQELVDGDVFD